MFPAFWIIFSGFSYLLGSVPFGKLIGQKVALIDITTRGSGNIGATNVARELGLKWGFFTLFLDLLKGFLPLYLFLRLFPDQSMGVAIAGIPALLGHQFSLFQRFRGGKGVATTLGIYLAIVPLPCLLALILFILTVALLDIVSLGSMLAVSAMPFILYISGKSTFLIITSFIIAGLICFKHRDNIQRLTRGEERRWRKRSVTQEVQGVDPALHRNRNR